MRGCYPTPLHTSNFSDLRELVTLPRGVPFVSDRPLASINRCFTVIQGQWLVPLDATRHCWHHICPYVRLWGANSGPQPWDVRCLDHSTTTCCTYIVEHALNAALRILRWSALWNMHWCCFKNSQWSALWIHAHGVALRMLTGEHCGTCNWCCLTECSLEVALLNMLLVLF